MSAFTQMRFRQFYAQRSHSHSQRGAEFWKDLSVKGGNSYEVGVASA